MNLYSLFAGWEQETHPYDTFYYICGLVALIWFSLFHLHIIFSRVVWGFCIFVLDEEET